MCIFFCYVSIYKDDITSSTSAHSLWVCVLNEVHRVLAGAASAILACRLRLASSYGRGGLVLVARALLLLLLARVSKRLLISLLTGLLQLAFELVDEILEREQQRA